MFVLTIVLGVLTMSLGLLLIFSFQTLQKISQVANRIVFDENWVINHRVALGLLLLGLTGFLFTGAYFMAKFNAA